MMSSNDGVTTRSQAAASVGSPKAAGSAAAAPAGGELIYDVLMADHRALEPLLDQLVATSQINEDTSRLLTQISQMLIPHSRAEEETFYNAIRASDPNTSLPLHGYKEHAEAEGILRTLQGANAVGVEWTAQAKRLREGILHHVQEEETDIFSRGRAIFSDQEAREIAKAFKDVKAQAEQQSAAGGMFHMMVNLLPPWLADRLSSRKDPLAEQTPKA